MQNRFTSPVKTLFAIRPLFWRIGLENMLSLLALYLMFQIFLWLVDFLYPSTNPAGINLVFLSGLIVLWLGLSYFVTRYEVRHWSIQLVEGMVEGEPVRCITGPTEKMASVSFPQESLDLPRTLSDRKRGLRGWVSDMRIWSNMSHAVYLRRRYFSHVQVEALWKMLEEVQS